ncbi:MAG: gamma-glutamyltransferase [Gammaproteobacteria bacterium]|nr:gamma-glutamyltransferase [Gammaproteobacteria bacterium]
MTHSDYPFASRRSAVMAPSAMVASSQPLASQAGLSALAAGGSAVDAAIAAAATLTVVEPTSNGLGSDAFALVWDGTRLLGLNGSGRWPAAADADWLRNTDGSVRTRGWPSVTVPGAVDAWATLHERYGRLGVDQLLEPAIQYAESGFPVSPVIATLWQAGGSEYGAHLNPELAHWADTFAPGGRTPAAGERWNSPAHARSLRGLAARGFRDFYEGEVGEALVRFSQSTGGRLAADDLADHASQWVDPISIDYGDLQVWELPPNGQGIAALIALGIYDRLGHHADLMSGDNWHAQIESMKLAFADAYGLVADPEHAPVPIEGLLDSGYLAARAALVGEQAGAPRRGQPDRGGTVYLCCADADGMMVSFIQSNYEGFGSGLVVPEFGVALQNRAAGFTLEAGHPNLAAPGKRPRHTIIPGFLTRAGEALGPFGVMGGEMQPQGHLQSVVSLADHGLNPQAALDKPRWRLNSDNSISVEPGTPEGLVADLSRRGHLVRRSTSGIGHGRGQIILRLAAGGYVAGSEPRADGSAVGY